MITTRDKLIASRARASQRRWVAEAGESADAWRKLPEHERLDVLGQLADATIEAAVNPIGAQAAIGALLAPADHPAPLLAIAPLARAIVGHVQDHDATIAVQTADAARLLGVAPEALDVALREAMRASGLTVLVGGLRAEIEALRAELADLATEAGEACEGLSASMRSALAEDAR